MKREELSLMVFPFGYDLLKGTMTMQEVFALAAEKGLNKVDVLGVDENWQGVCRDAIDQTGVKVYCFIANLSFFQEEEGLAEDLKKSMAVAKTLDAKLFMIVPYNTDAHLAQAAEEGREKVLDRMVKGFRLAVKMGEEEGLKVCFETTPHDETCLSGTEDCAYVLDQVPGLGLVFDTANMLPHGEDTLAAYEALKEYIIYAHLKDVALDPMDPFNPLAEHSKDGRFMRGCVWGDGVIPVAEVERRLRADGYTGTYAMEYAHPGVFTKEAHSAQLDRFLQYFTI